MDSLTQMIVDLLRRGKENEALNQGGLTAGTPDAALMERSSAAHVSPGAPMAPAGRGPRGIEPKHEGRTYDEIVAKFEQG